MANPPSDMRAALAAAADGGAAAAHAMSDNFDYSDDAVFRETDAAMSQQISTELMQRLCDATGGGGGGDASAAAAAGRPEPPATALATALRRDVGGGALSLAEFYAQNEDAVLSVAVADAAGLQAPRQLLEVELKEALKHDPPLTRADHELARALDANHELLAKRTVTPKYIANNRFLHPHGAEGRGCVRGLEDPRTCMLAMMLARQPNAEFSARAGSTGALIGREFLYPDEQRRREREPEWLPEVHRTCWACLLATEHAALLQAGAPGAGGAPGAPFVPSYRAKVGGHDGFPEPACAPVPGAPGMHVVRFDPQKFVVHRGGSNQHLSHAAPERFF